MLVFKNIWGNLFIKVIKTICRHTNILSSNYEIICPVIIDAQREHVCLLVAEFVLVPNGTSIDYLLNAANEEACMQDLDAVELVGPTRGPGNMT